MGAGDIVNVVKGRRPADYHCDCRWCKVSLGELRKPDGSYYSRLERREYYDKSERGRDGHVAKTPLHIARWAVQAFTKPGDWVLDPTIGAGTTAVEALTQGRNVAGMEVQFGSILKANINKNHRDGVKAAIRIGDARRIGHFLEELGEKFQLVVNNPPYSGDENMLIKSTDKKGPWTMSYKDGLPNLAFLKEGPEYWEAMGGIYQACADHLRSGGYFVTGIKDMMRSKEPFLLHRDFCKLLEQIDLRLVGTAFLKHYPTTLFLNTYEKRYGVRPPLYQTIGVFQK